MLHGKCTAWLQPIAAVVATIVFLTTAPCIQHVQSFSHTERITTTEVVPINIHENHAHWDSQWLWLQQAALRQLISATIPKGDISQENTDFTAMCCKIITFSIFAIFVV